ncbi:MAG: DUF58 domain-containing protein [Actinophytocola sp.]|uniref:DUF58 domain-containing protein n=1 Tax=Actinophytocola sp. TaxID=1872138 RepID=UPI0013267245|nr:DUF58 domain-containing protein [Actinophytocola sp.]MPZ83128.1 DUF58 domain-containing protein [Actinophytocola sp.]
MSFEQVVATYETRQRGLGRRARRWFLGRREVRSHGWRRTDALLRAVACGFGLAVAGVALHRLELLLVGLPLLVSMMLVSPPTGRPKVREVKLADTVEADLRSRVTVSMEPGEGAAIAALRMPVASRSGVGPVHLLPAVTGEVHAVIRWNTWGLSNYLRPDHLMASHDGLYVLGPVVGRTTNHTVLPPIDPLRAAPLPPRAAGLVGAHRSARPGDGMELRDIRPFQSGDRLRRVDWRVSLRAAAASGGELVPGTLHVRERHAEADADLLLALDTTLDVGRRIADWAEVEVGAAARVGGSLDTGVRAVSSLAATFLRQGDRVGLIDIGQPRGGVSAGSGRRQLQRIRHSLVLSAQRVSGAGEPVLRTAQVPPGATVVILSPFLDDKLVELTVRAARRGNLVIAVDVLPPDLVPDEETPWGEAVRAIVVAEQRVRLAVLGEHGVPVVRWADGTLGTVLQSARRRIRGRR